MKRYLQLVLLLAPLVCLLGCNPLKKPYLTYCLRMGRWNGFI